MQMPVEPIGSYDQFIARLAKLNPISVKYRRDREALLARYRKERAEAWKNPAILSPPERLFRSNFRNLFFTAQCMAANDLDPQGLMDEVVTCQLALRAPLPKWTNTLRRSGMPLPSKRRALGYG
jgi:hypothetical protein